ncbi:MAG: hypothetical protein ALECFALPRED_007940 [Alectoria fallacina]|uniref:Uncharacterized protein n=1 Tax=Alectoria fallacina TaxID=1903189 RepID=A0A8H3PF31_9LECA|nr:MAG: hypothetical protein ALECFALPRED_007940 [Alectoria fallacina]
MCRYEFYLSTACGHHFPKLPPPARPDLFFNNYHPTIAVPESLTCAAVKLALKFYHDQVVYLPADMNCGAKVDIPKSCPIVHRPRDGPTKRTIKEQEKAIRMLTETMLENGLGPWQEWQVEINAAVLDQCSNRAKPGEHSRTALRRHQELQYPRNMYAHVQNVKAFQARDKRFMMPNVTYTNVDFGCGGPFSAECLTGWDRVGLVTQRLHLWGDAITHPKPCNHECLTGWSGADLDTYRQQIWVGDNPKNWGHFDYAEFARDYTFKNTLPSKRWGLIDYSFVSHLHADQFGWNGKGVARKHHLPNGQVVHVPEMVSIPVPESLDQVLREMARLARLGSPLPKEADQASIEDILDRLPEAFNEQDPLTGDCSEPLMGAVEGSESGTTVVGEPEEEEKPIPVEETPEMAEARRQRARKDMREKIARDFSKGKGKMAVEEG